MDGNVLKLKLALEEKTPTLLLGAGFSYGAINGTGDSLPLGKNLVEKLFRYMFIDNPPCKEMLDEDIEGAEQYKNIGDLKGLCGLLRDEGRVEERDNFLTETFMGASISDKSKLNNICLLYTSPSPRDFL